MLEALVRCEGVDWTKVDCIHLDEYVGTPPASPNLPHLQQLFAPCRAPWDRMGSHRKAPTSPVGAMGPHRDPICQKVSQIR